MGDCGACGGHLQSFREVADVYDVLALIVPDQIQRLQRAVDQS